MHAAPFAIFIFLVYEYQRLQGYVILLCRKSCNQEEKLTTVNLFTRLWCNRRAMRSRFPDRLVDAFETSSPTEDNFSRF